MNDFASKLAGGEIDKPKKFTITYTLQGQEYVECLDAYLDVRGDQVLRMGRDELEKLHVDLGYYRVTFIFALKEMGRTVYDLEVQRTKWLSKARLAVHAKIRDDRFKSKKEGNNLDTLTQREIDDNVIATYPDEYFEWDSKIHDAQSDVDRVKDLIKEIDARRIQFQGLVKYRYSP